MSKTLSLQQFEQDVRECLNHNRVAAARLIIHDTEQRETIKRQDLRISALEHDNAELRILLDAYQSQGEIP